MKRLYRSQRDKKIAGICGGLGEMFAIDSTLIRLAVVFLTAILILIYRGIGGVLPILVAYVVGWIIVPVAPPQHDTGEAMRMKKLVRSRTDKKIAGICGGLGEMFAIDSTLIRLVTVFVGLITAILPIVIAYIVGWIVIPLAPPPEEKDNRRLPAA